MLQTSNTEIVQMTLSVVKSDVSVAASGAAGARRRKLALGAVVRMRRMNSGVGNTAVEPGVKSTAQS